MQRLNWKQKKNIAMQHIATWNIKRISDTTTIITNRA